MAIVTNTHRTALALPGITLQPNTPTPVHNWDRLSKNHVVSAWVKAGVLKVDDAPAGDQGSQYIQPDKAELHAKLHALQVQYDKRSGVAKLQALLADAEAAHAARVEAEALAGGGYTAEQFAALPEEERAGLLAAAADRLRTKTPEG